MSTARYDVIVVGARCAGSPTAMLLAQRGHRVLLVDRARFPSDTVSTHLVHPPGVAALRAMGPARPGPPHRVPAGRHLRLRLRPVRLEWRTRHRGRSRSRTRRAGRRSTRSCSKRPPPQASRSARDSPSPTSSPSDGRVEGIRGHARDGRAVTDRAAVVVGADGVHSVVAAHVAPRDLRGEAAAAGRLLRVLERPADGRPVRGVQPAGTRVRGLGDQRRPDRRDRRVALRASSTGTEPTSRPTTARCSTSLPASRSGSAAPPSRRKLVGAAVPNYFRKPFGPGWALVGDAGYLKDFITSQGIQDAFLDAELCATAISESLAGQRTHRRRDARLPGGPGRAGQVDVRASRPTWPRSSRPHLNWPVCCSHFRATRTQWTASPGMNAGVTSPEEFFARPGSDARTA